MRVEADAQASFRYRIYGMTVNSDFDLQGLPPAGDEAQSLRIARLEPDGPPLPEESPILFDFTGGQPLLAWRTVGAFRIASTSRIEVRPAPGVDDRLISLPLLGGVLASLLHRRGLYVLHASAVAVEGRAIVLLGDKGAGKSTTAATLLAAGHGLLADDVVAIDMSNPAGPLVLPAFGQLKLWDDAAAGLAGGGLSKLWQLHSSIDKANYAAAASFAAAATPLARLYRLNRAPDAAVAALPDGKSLATLLEHSYMTRFGSEGFGDRLGEHFARSADLSRRGLVRRLDVPAGLDRIGAIVATVQDDLEEHFRGNSPLAGGAGPGAASASDLAKGCLAAMQSRVEPSG